MSYQIENVSYQCGDLTLNGLAFGDKHLPVVLCLHGWLDNAASFLPIMPYLSNRRVIAIDWAGHGLSSHRSWDAHYHFFDWVNDLFNLFIENGWRNIDIVGHSMGGMVASAFAAAFPEKVRSLTLIDIVGFITLEPSLTTKQLRKGILNRSKVAKKNTISYGSEELALEARVMASDLTNQNAKLIVKRGIVKKINGYEWCYDKRLIALSPYRMSLQQAQQLVTDIKSPVQVIRGDKGLELVTAGALDFAELFNDLQFHSLVGGHHVHMEKPQATAKLILNFTSS